MLILKSNLWSGRNHHPSRAARLGTPVRSRFWNKRPTSYLRTDPFPRIGKSDRRNHTKWLESGALLVLLNVVSWIV